MRLPEHSVTSLDVVHEMDALMLMDALPAQSVDAIITDMPYGTTASSWDTIVPFDAWWQRVRRVLKPRGVMVTTASQPFTSALVMSNPEMFKYCWVWQKSVAANFFNAKNKPLARHEDICIFSLGTVANTSPNRMNYYPQGINKVDKAWKRPRKYESAHRFDRESHQLERIIEYSGYPSSIINIPNGHNNFVHPTQKSVALYEYLIRTYTQPGDVVLDPFCGSGTTGVAARNTKRHYILGDFTREYVDIARLRINGTGIDMLNAKEAAPLADLPLFAQAVNT